MKKNPKKQNKEPWIPPKNKIKQNKRKDNSHLKDFRENLNINCKLKKWYYINALESMTIKLAICHRGRSFLT